MDMIIVGVVLVVWFVLTAGLITFVYFRSKASETHRAVIESLQNASALYSDNFCSGHSLKSFRTKFAGARNSLKVVVTQDVLYVTSSIQFLVYFTEKFDLEHTIPKKSIQEFAKLKRLLQTGFRVAYLDKGGEVRRIELWPRRPGEFEQAMSVGFHSSIK
jgi:hypothetical protein